MKLNFTIKVQIIYSMDQDNFQVMFTNTFNRIRYFGKNE
jgi:hypothetical protein